MRQDRLLSYWPQLAETTLPGFQEVFGTSLRLLQRLNPMKRYSRRQYLQGYLLPLFWLYHRLSR